MIGAFEGVATVSGRPGDTGVAGAPARAAGDGTLGDAWALGLGAGRVAGAPNGVSGTRGAPPGACRSASGSARNDGFGWGGAAGDRACGCGAAIGVDESPGAAGGAPRGSDRGGCTVALGDDGGIVGATVGVGRRPGANGGTRVGVALRGAPAGGVRRPGGAAPPGRGSAPGRSINAAALPNDGPDRADAVRLAASCGVAKSSVQLRAVVIGMIPPQTEHRARTPGPGTLDGSTRNTDWHSGHETFMTRRPG